MTRRLAQYKVQQIDKHLRRAHELMHKAVDPKKARVTAAALKEFSEELRAVAQGMDELSTSPFLAIEPESHATLKEPVLA